MRLVPVAGLALTAPGVTRLLTPHDVAERLAVSRSMVYALVRRGVLPATYVGRLPRIAEADLVAYLEGQRREGGR